MVLFDYGNWSICIGCNNCIAFYTYSFYRYPYKLIMDHPIQDNDHDSYFGDGDIYLKRQNCLL